LINSLVHSWQLYLGQWAALSTLDWPSAESQFELPDLAKPLLFFLQE
jgi:hypothetical protein